MAAEPEGGGDDHRAGRPRLILPSTALAAIRAHAAAAFPEECCGILVGRAEPSGSPPGEEGCGTTTRVVRAVAAANARRDRPHDRYAIPPETLLATHKAARAEGLEMVGYYHSHPGSGSEPATAAPSRFDRRHAWPRTSYLILPVTAGRPGPPRSWRLANPGETEEEGEKSWVEEQVVVTGP